MAAWRFGILAMASEAAMPSRGIADSPSYGPEALNAMGAAFDAAWAEIESTFTTGQAAVTLARLQLASAVLSVADDASRDVQVLKRAALQAMARGCRQQYSEGTPLAPSSSPSPSAAKLANRS